LGGTGEWCLVRNHIYFVTVAPLARDVVSLVMSFKALGEDMLIFAMVEA